MADPFSMAVTGIGSSIFGSLTSAAGAKESADANSNAALYQAHIAQINAQLARQNAAFALQTGEINASHTGAQYAERLGQEKAGQGASGLDVNSGSALAVRNSTDELAVRDQGVIRDNAAQRAYAYNVGATSDDLQSQLDQQKAKYAKQAGSLGVASSILGGAGSVASKWIQGNQAGLWNG